MPITVKHGVSADVLGESAYFAGKGARAERDLDREREDIALDKQLQDRAQGRATQTQIASENRQEQARQFDTRAKASQKAYDESPERELDMLEAKANIDRTQMQFAYTEGQKQDQDKISNALAWVPL